MYLFPFNRRHGEWGRLNTYMTAMKKRMWRGVVNNSGGTGLMNRRMREMAEALVAQLRKDGFL